MTREEAFALHTPIGPSCPRYATDTDGNHWNHALQFPPPKGRFIFEEYYRKPSARRGLMKDRLPWRTLEALPGWEAVDWLPGEFLPFAEWPGPLDEQGRLNYFPDPGEMAARKRRAENRSGLW